MSYTITLGSELLNSLVYADALLGGNTELKPGMVFTLQAMENKTVTERKDGDKTVFFEYLCNGRKYSFNIYSLPFMLQPNGESPLEVVVGSSSNFKLADSFEIMSVAPRTNRAGELMYPLSAHIGYGAFTTAELKVLTEDQRAKIKATDIRADAKPLQTITLKDCILIECN